MHRVKSLKTIAKLNEFGFNLLPEPTYSPDLTASIYWLFGFLKKMPQEKRFSSNEEVVAAVEPNLEAKDKSFYKLGIKHLEKHSNDCIALEGGHVEEYK